MFIFVQMNVGEHEEPQHHCQTSPNKGDDMVSRLTLVIGLLIVLDLVVAALAAAGAGLIARIEGLDYVQALKRSASVFAVALTVAATFTSLVGGMISGP
jgi:hypothetical protein